MICSVFIESESLYHNNNNNNNNNIYLISNIKLIKKHNQIEENKDM